MKKNTFLQIIQIFIFILLISTIGIIKVKAIDTNIIKSINIDKNIIKPLDTVNLAIEFNDINPSISTLIVIYRNRDSNVVIEKNAILTLNNNSYVGSIQLTENDVRGNWIIEAIRYGDKIIYNSELYSSDDLILSNLGDGNFLLDSLNEAQINIDFLSINKIVAKNGEEVSLKIGLVAKDLELQSYAIVTYITPSRISRNITLRLNGDKYEGTIPVGEYDENGISKILRIVVNSSVGTSFQLYNSTLGYSNATDLSRGDFEIIDNVNGISPKLLSVRLDKKLVDSNEVVNILVNAEDYISGLSSYSYVCYRKPDGITRNINLNLVNGVYEGKINISSSEDVGKWHIEFIAIRNNSEYEAITYINSSDSNNKILIDGEFTVVRNSDVDNDTVIGIKDLDEVANHYNLMSNDVNWFEKYDINLDNIVDIYDLVNISKNMAK